MTNHQFIAAQDRIGCTGAKLASWLGVTPLTVTRYRTGFKQIPGPVAVAIMALETGWRPDTPHAAPQGKVKTGAGW